MRGDNLKRHKRRRDHWTGNETKDNVVTKGLHDWKIEDNSCKCKYCEDDRQSEGGEDHLTEQETEDNVEINGQYISRTGEKFIAVQKKCRLK